MKNIQLLALKNFYKLGVKFYRSGLILGGSLTLLGVSYGLFMAPSDYIQQDAFRIIYLHVPAAFVSLSLYALLGSFSAIYLIWRVKVADVIALACAPIGAGFTLLALITGAIWGQPMWGTWWVWDARLTSELILLFLYFGYMALRSAIKDQNKAGKACAIIGVVGLIDLPIIHYSVKWWNTLHQGPTLSQFAKPSIASQMLWPLILSITGVYIFCISCVLLKSSTEILWRERKQKWVKDLG